MAGDLALQIETLDKKASLRSLPNDREVAQDLINAISAISRLQDAAHTEIVQKAIPSVLGGRGMRLLIEQVWEIPRRAEGEVLHRKYAINAVWSTQARELASPSTRVRATENWINRLVLEHVVPMKTVLHVIRYLIQSGANSDAVVAALHGLCRHVVLTRPEDAILPRDMSTRYTRMLSQTYANERKTLFPDLLEMKWSRYPLAIREVLC